MLSVAVAPPGPSLVDASLLATPGIPTEAWRGRLLTGLGQAIDGMAVAAMRFIVDRAIMPPADQLERMREAAAPYATAELLQDPTRFFAFDHASLTLRDVDMHPRRRLDGGWILSHRAKATLAPFVGGDAATETVHVEHWAHVRAKPRAVVLALHGFGMGNTSLDALALYARTWYALGLDVALLALPAHGPRTPAGARFSGERFATADPAQINENVRRAVCEALAVARWLGTELAVPVGVLGMSLGGYLAAVIAALTDELAFAVPMVPPVCMGDLAWRFFEQSRHHRGDKPLGLSRADLRDAFRVHSPLAHRLRMTRDKILIVAGRGDRVVPPEHPHALWRHWGEPAIHWYSGGHMTPFGRSAIARAVADHLRVVGCA
jgi:hypothetical protein